MMLAKGLLAVLLALNATSAFGEIVKIVGTVVDEHGQPVVDAVVTAMPADAIQRLPERPRESVVDQVDKEFIPKVIAIAVGTSVTFPNHDNVRHHVYSFSPAKRFELPLYAGVPAQPVLFDKPGIVVLGCNIHDWMVGYIYVSETPFFAKTGKDGKAVLADLPPRVYIVHVWHPEIDGTEESTGQRVDTTRARLAEVNWTLKLKAEVRVHRAPTPDRSGHY